MQTNIDETNDRFRRRFQQANLAWFIIALLAVSLTSWGLFSSKPQYLHDWHIIAVVFLELLLLSTYASLFFRPRIFHGRRDYRDWPPPLSASLPYWFSTYITVFLLSLINAEFAWCFFIVFGLSSGFFQGWRLISAFFVLFISLCALQGYFSWPPLSSQLAQIFSIGIIFISFSIFTVLLQHLIGERFERNRLIAQLAQSNAELEEAQHKLEETAAQEQELAVLRERTRLAREMHDTLGHALVLVSVKLEAAQRLRERDPERCERELEATKEIVRHSMKELRASIANLRSPSLEREPASRAIARYAREMAQRVGFNVTCDLHPNIEGLPEQVEDTLWKVGQEVLTNVEKHARARNVSLHIHRQAGTVTLRIEDDGVGLPVHLCQLQSDGSVSCHSPEGHYGLNGICERVENCGGRFSLRASEEQGTLVEVELPLVEAPLPSPAG